MKKWKFWCSLGLVAVMLAGTLLAGCAQQSTDYTKEIREYQEKLESLAAENEALRAQLEGVGETGEAESETETENLSETEAVEETAEETAEETQSAEETQAQTEEQPAESESAQQPAATEDDDVMRILVFGDSIWDSTRDATGVASKVEEYMEKAGQEVEIYDATVGGTRATLDQGEDPYSFSPGREWSLPKMVSILTGQSDIEWMLGMNAYQEFKAALEVKDELDMVILSYGMNDFLMQVPINASDEVGAWTGYGTSLKKEIVEIRRTLPNADVMICGPTYASYLPLPISNMGSKALYNYAAEAATVGEAMDTLVIDPYNYMGVDAYNEEEYLEDGIHLTEKGRDLYARCVVNCLLYGTPGTVSGNAIEFDD